MWRDWDVDIVAHSAGPENHHTVYRKLCGGVWRDSDVDIVAHSAGPENHHTVTDWASLLDHCQKNTAVTVLWHS